MRHPLSVYIFFEYVIACLVSAWSATGVATAQAIPDADIRTRQQAIKSVQSYFTFRRPKGQGLPGMNLVDIIVDAMCSRVVA